jgi:4-amino-4-deoxy-L-arabinose transferase-like glycosyltransferase
VLLVYFPRKPDDDTDVYRELGYNLFHHGTYGMMEDGDLSPSLFRLPGYPLFLNALGGNLLVVQLAQIALDLLGCVLLGLLVRRYCGERAGLWTLGLSATCLFTAIYSAAGMTECLTVFCIAVALWALGRFLANAEPFAGRGLLRRLLPLAAASGFAMLLRPDGALLTVATAVALAWYGVRRGGWRKAIAAALLFCCLAAVPLVPWTIRNALTFHVFQPLAPRHVNDPGERVNTGFYDWLRTWTFEFESTGSVFWREGSEPIRMEDIPDLAFDSPAQRARTAELIARYNVRKDLDPQLDDEFEALARARIKANPLRYYVGLPALRVLDMTFRPRVDSTWIPADWQELAESPALLAAAILFALLNLFYFGTAFAGIISRRTRPMIPLGVFMMTYILLRCAMLGAMENPEPRYTVEFFPMVLVCAGVWFGARRGLGADIRERRPL